MNRTLFLFLVVAVIVGAVIGGSVWLSSGQQGDGSLTIEGAQPGLIVKVDGTDVGQTPLAKIIVAAGDRTIEIGNGFKEKLSIAEDSDSLVHRQVAENAQFSQGYSLGYEQLRTLLSSQGRVLIASRPAEAKITIDGNERGATPLVVSDLSAGDHTVEVERAGYQPQKITITVKEKRLAVVNVDLFPSLITETKRINPTTLIGEGQPMITARAQWGNGGVRIQAEDVKLAPWQKLDIWEGPLDKSVIKNDVRNVPQFLKDFDGFLQNQAGVGGLPYAYVVDEKGTIYEGWGIYDFDFSQINGFDFQAGSAPVLVLNTEGEALNEPVRKSLAQLKTYLGQVQPVTAKLTTPVEPFALTTGERHVIEVHWQNTSGMVWQPNTGRRIALVVNSDPRRAVLYDPETWRSPEEVGTFADSLVLPGAEATFRFALKAPYYSGEFTEKLVLKDIANQQIIDGSEITVAVKVTGEVSNVLQIQETPLGFLNVRAGPNNNTALLTTVFPGEKFAWTKEENGWLEIILQDGSKGWVTTNYIKKIQ